MTSFPEKNTFSMKGCYLFFLRLVLLLFALAHSFEIFSQQTLSGIPFSALCSLEKVTSFEVMPTFSKEELKSDAPQVSSRLKILKFAHAFEVKFNPENSGAWTSCPNGDKLWRIGLVSKGAYSLNLIFNAYNLEPGVKLYIYTPNQENILGAFSSKNNNIANILAVEPLPGDSIIVELNVPSQVQNYGTLQISKVGHDFVNILESSSKLKSTGKGTSGSCNYDINCSPGLEWQREKYAVCHILVNGEDLCTGTLVNNTAKDNTPYVITANHCINSNLKAATSVFTFDYEKRKCGGVDGSNKKTIYGSQLMATIGKLDFSLVKLYWVPDFYFKPYFAGWDRSGNVPQSSATIHHPNGDFKKISIDNNPATIATFENGKDYNLNSHLLIGKWEIGTTEPGSSGAPLFNQNHQLVGDLTGGDANCTLSVNDYFTRIYNAWSTYTDWSQQLEHWLDPLNSDSMRIQGLDPYAAEKNSCDTFWNISSTETRRLYNTNLTWGNYSGHNSRSFTQFAEKIGIGGTLKIPGFYLHVAKAYNASPLSYITIKLWKNGNVPGEEITSRSIYIKDLIADQENFLEFDSVIFVSGPVYLGYSVNYSAISDTFAVYQSQDRGPAEPSSMFVFRNGTWRSITEDSSPSLHSALGIGLISCGLINGVPEDEIKTQTLLVYPNPVTTGTMCVELPKSGKAVVSVFNLEGKSSAVQVEQKDSLLCLNTSSLPTGIYLLKVVIPGEGIYNAKFMVIK